MITGLEPHPVIQALSPEEILALGPQRFADYKRRRREAMMLERTDPFRYGFEPEIWHVVDQLLCDGKKVLITVPGAVDVPKEMIGYLEILITGSNRSAKSEYCGKKIMKVLNEADERRTWSFAETGPISIARQQPLLYRYLPQAVRQLTERTGRARQGTSLNIAYSRKNGFTEQTFVLPNSAQHWFKNYAQDIENVEGDQLDAIWLDEGAKVDLIKTLRFRLGDRNGILLISFTPIDDSYTQTVNEYEKGSREVFSVPAELLPKKDKDGNETGEFERVPRVKIAGPGSDGNQRANIVYFHITDNPYFGFTGKPKPGETPTFGKERFYKMLRGATRAKILSRAYGVATKAAGNQFPKFSEIHVVDPERVPRSGTNFHLVDPCPGRNWYQVWFRVDPAGRAYAYREWPSYGHPGAYIPGIGDPGPWTLPGGRKANGGVAYDGERGPAQNPFGWSLVRYYDEILRLEGHPEESRRRKIEAVEQEERRQRLAPSNPLANIREQIDDREPDPAAENQGTEHISERWMDSRYGASPTQTKDRITTLIEQMADLGMDFRAASGKEIGEGVALINDLLDFDQELPLGDYSPALNRINEPRLYVSRDCPNLIYALREWTGKDGQHGACKDPVDVCRYFVLEECEYVEETANTWAGGGSY